MVASLICCYLFLIGGLVSGDFVLCQGLSLLGTPAGCLKGTSPVISAGRFEHLHNLMLFCYLSTYSCLLFYFGLLYT